MGTMELFTTPLLTMLLLTMPSLLSTMLLPTTLPQLPTTQLPTMQLPSTMPHPSIPWQSPTTPLPSMLHLLPTMQFTMTLQQFTMRLLHSIMQLPQSTMQLPLSMLSMHLLLPLSMQLLRSVMGSHLSPTLESRQCWKRVKNHVIIYLFIHSVEYNSKPILYSGCMVLICINTKQSILSDVHDTSTGLYIKWGTTA